MKSQVFQPCVLQNLLVDVDDRVRVVHLAGFLVMGTSTDCWGVFGVLQPADRRHPVGWRFF